MSMLDHLCSRIIKKKMKIKKYIRIRFEGLMVVHQMSEFKECDYIVTWIYLLCTNKLLNYELVTMHHRWIHRFITSLIITRKRQLILVVFRPYRFISHLISLFRIMNHRVFAPFCRDFTRLVLSRVSKPILNYLLLVQTCNINCVISWATLSLRCQLRKGQIFRSLLLFVM